MAKTITFDELKEKCPELTRKQVKALRDRGLHVHQMTINQAEDVRDAYLEIAFSDDENAVLDELPNSRATELFKIILSKTHGSPDQEKNLSTSGDDTQTATE